MRDPSLPLGIAILVEPKRSLRDIVAIKLDLEELFGYPVDVLATAGSRHALLSVQEHTAVGLLAKGAPTFSADARR